MKPLNICFVTLIFSIFIMANSAFSQPAETVNSSLEKSNNTLLGRPTSFAPGFADYSQVDIDSTFTLQLVAMDDLDKAIAYAKKYQIDPKQAGIARTHSNGKVWYILALGVYPTRDEASDASADLISRGIPAPWVRTLASIETLSREANALDM